jgi:hypothetical protein
MTLAQLRIGMSRRAPIDFPMPSEIRLSRMGQSAALSALTFLNLFLGLSAQAVVFLRLRRAHGPQTESCSPFEEKTVQSPLILGPFGTIPLQKCVPHGKLSVRKRPDTSFRWA